MMLAQLLADGRMPRAVRPVYGRGQRGGSILSQRRKPDVVCISATPPAAVMHARHLCRLVRGRFPEVPVVVGLWDAQGDLSKAKTRIGGGATTHVVATLAEAQEQVRLLIQPSTAGTWCPPPAEKAAGPESRIEVMEAAHP